MDAIKKGRVLKWEEQALPLLEAKSISATAVKKEFRRADGLDDLLAERTKKVTGAV